MAYTPINWQTGDTITAEKMNKMDNGWGIQQAQLFSESATTVDTGSGFASCELAYGSLIDAPTITVTFNNTDYTVNRGDMGGRYYYGEIGTGGPSFVNYPFFIDSADEGGVFNSLYTASAGTYAVSVSTEGVQTSSNFSEAVNQCVDTSAMPMLCVNGVTTIAQANTAKNNGQLLYFWTEYSGCFFINDIGGSCVIYPESETLSAYFDNDFGIFHVVEA